VSTEPVPTVIYVMGGRGENGQPLCECDRLQTKDILPEWTPAPPMLEARWGAAAATVGGKIYVFGGYSGGGPLRSAECFDPSTGEWEALRLMSVARSHACAAPVGKRPYVCGGYGIDRCLSSAERYDPETKEWEVLPNMLSPRHDAASASIGPHLYVFGGADGGSEPLNTAERFDAKEGTWQEIPPMFMRRLGAAAASLTGCLYVISGHNGVEAVNTAERFVPYQNKWEALPRTKKARYSGAAAMALSNDRRQKVFVFGGHDGINRIGHGEAYEPETETWTEVVRDMPQVRAAAVAAGIAPQDEKGPVV